MDKCLLARSNLVPAACQPEHQSDADALCWTQAGMQPHAHKATTANDSTSGSVEHTLW